jgi:hypothetical protein
MNLELLLSGRVLSMAFIFVAFLGISALIFVYAESVAPSVPTTKSISDTIPFLREVADTTPPIDTTPPVVTVPVDMKVEATGPEGRIVSYESTATDTVDGNVATVCSPKSGSLFALGQTRVECTAVDKAGNTGKNQFIITVRDTTPPETTLGDVTVGWLGSITSGDTTPSVDSNFDFDGTDLVGISHYECRLEDGGWKSAHKVTDINGEKINTCTYTGVRDPGAHNFEVRAVDTSGNKDASPASFMWNIEAPDQAIQGLITRVNSIYQSLNLDSALHQAVEDLSDNSVSNDPNSCYLLNSFMNDLNVQNMIGTLSLTDLNDFVKTTLAIMDNIGCLPPIANAGSPQSVEAGEKGVMLDGSNSLHADNPISFNWKQIGGSPTVEIRNSAKAKASFDAPTSDQFKDVGSSTTLTFELTVAGAGDLKSTAITTVEVNAVNNPPEEPGVNNPPVAKSQSVTTYSDKSISINLDATDKDGDSLTYSLTSSPNHGSLSSFDKNTGTVVYTPKSGYTGNDGFTFTANDKSSTSNSAKVSITVNSVSSGTTKAFSMAAVGDWGCTSNTDKTVKKISSEKPNIVLALGDYSYEPSADCWLKAVKPIDDITKITIGNHEDSPNEDLDAYMSNFGMNKQFYSFTKNNVHFVVMATEIPYKSGSDQYKFVVNDLSKASTDKNVDWIVVFMHRIMYTSPTSCSSCGALSDLRETYHPLFDKYGVDFVLQGHAHDYQRSYPLQYNQKDAEDPIVTDKNSGKYNDPKGEIYAIVGTGGEDFHALKSKSSFIASQNDARFGHLNLDTSKSATTKILNGQFIGNDGKIMDEFQIMNHQ